MRNFYFFKFFPSELTFCLGLFTRSWLTGFQVILSILKAVPIIAPSISFKISSTVPKVTPVLAKTGTSPVFSLISLIELCSIFIKQA
jgi:hypothetical protein